MDVPDLVGLFVRPLERLEIPYMITGGVASVIYVPPLETLYVEATRQRHGYFVVIHRDSALRADIYLAGDDPLHAWAFERTRRLTLENLTIRVAPIEYVVVRKLE